MSPEWQGKHRRTDKQGECVQTEARRAVGGEGLKLPSCFLKCSKKQTYVRGEGCDLSRPVQVKTSVEDTGKCAWKTSSAGVAGE